MPLVIPLKMVSRMTLRERQSLFVKCLGQLIAHVYALGNELTLADGSIDKVRKYIDKDGKVVSGRDAVHKMDGLHYVRLAQDLNLFVDGIWKDKDCKEWQELGMFWKSLHPECAWGGDFASVDLNHFSVGYQGKF